MPIDLELHFQNYKHFLKFFGLYLFTTVNEKAILAIFIYLFIYEVTTTKVNFLFYRNSAVKLQHVLFENESFLCKMLVSFFSSNIPLYIGKNPVEKLCKVLEVELIKGYLHYKTITSQTMSSEAQINNFFVS